MEWFRKNRKKKERKTTIQRVSYSSQSWKIKHNFYYQIPLPHFWHTAIEAKHGPSRKSILWLFPTIFCRDRRWHVGLVFDRRGGVFNRQFSKGRGRGGSGRGRGGGGASGRRSGDGGRFDCLTSFISLTRPYNLLLLFGVFGFPTV